ncbi:MAG: hypothetical protein Q4D88_01755 [Anaerococcus sp.]|nr:hypothetical protein [Anaerococcus sp.]
MATLLVLTILIIGYFRKKTFTLRPLEGTNTIETSIIPVFGPIYVRVLGDTSLEVYGQDNDKNIEISYMTSLEGKFLFLKAKKPYKIKSQKPVSISGVDVLIEDLEK